MTHLISCCATLCDELPGDITPLYDGTQPSFSLFHCTMYIKCPASKQTCLARASAYPGFLTPTLVASFMFSSPLLPGTPPSRQNPLELTQHCLHLSSLYSFQRPPTPSKHHTQHSRDSLAFSSKLLRIPLTNKLHRPTFSRGRTPFLSAG